MAKKKPEEDEDDLESKLDAAAADADDDDPDDEPDDGDEPEEVEVADKSDLPAPHRIRRPVGRPRKHPKPKPGEPDDRFFSRSSTLSEDGSPEAALFASKDVSTIWNHVLNVAREQNMPTEALVITVTRQGLGGMPSMIQDLSPINGDLVMGDEQTSPGEALVNYITQVYHLGIPTKGPKLYKCRFSYRTGTRNRVIAPIAELRLGSPDEVEAEIRARSQYAAQKIADDAVRGVTSRVRVPSMAGQGFGAPQSYPQPGYAQPPQPGYPYPPPQYPQYQPPPPIQGASPQLEEMRREMAGMMGALNERMRLEGLAPPPAPPAPVVQGPTAEETAARTAQIVAQVLTGMGFTPALAAKLNNPQLTSAAVQGAITDPLELLDKAFEQMERFRKLDQRLQDRYTPEEEEEPKKPELPPAGPIEVKVDKTAMKPVPLLQAFGKQVQWGERGEEESMVDYGLRLFMHNPELGAQAATWALSNLSNSAIGKLVAQLVAQGMPGAAQALQQQQQRQLPAAQANGAANGAVGAVTQPPAATTASSGFGAPKI